MAAEKNPEKEKAIGGQEKERFKFKHLPSLLKRTAIAWNLDDPWRLSAIVAYYAILSLPGLILVVVGVLSYFWGPELIEGQVYEQIEDAIGRDEAEAVESIFKNAMMAETSWIAAAIGVGGLLFGATAVFYHLQISLNQIWNVTSDPKSAILRYLIDRAKSFAFVLLIGFMLLVNFIISIVISAMQEYIAEWFPDVTYYLFTVADILISLSVMTVLFALMFKYLPDVHISWRSVWIGAFITSFLFALGNEILSYYFGAANPGNVYGAAGSMIIILLWVTYSCLILFFGAEFTYVYTKRYGYKMKPKSHARLIIEERSTKNR
jgi:membrane protein